MPRQGRFVDTGSHPRKKARLFKTWPRLTLVLFLLLPAGPLGETSAAAEQTRPTSNQGKHQARGSPQTLSPEERWRLYLETNFWSAGAVFSSIFPASIRHWRDDPPEWEQSMNGYGKRVGNQFAMRSIQGSVNHGLAAIMNTDPRYRQCECTGFFPRLGYAVLSNLVTRTQHGTKTADLPNLAGVYVGSMASLSWYPDRYNWRGGFREGSQRLITSGSFNVFREFWPEIRRIIPFKRKP